MTPLERSAMIVFEKCLAVKDDEKVLIITDQKMKKIGELFYFTAHTLDLDARILVINAGKVHGEEPSKEVADEMKETDLVVIATTKSMSHTKARRDATDKGVRLVSMPGITEDILERAVDVDYELMKKMILKTAKILDAGNKINIRTEIGTDLSFDISKRKAHGLNGGIFDKPGKWGNLPEGEVFIAPIEGTANGGLVIDCTVGGIGKVDERIEMTIKDGFLTEIKGGKTAVKLMETLKRVDDRNAFNVAEFGIGMNDKAKVRGNALEDEKVLGTAHIAFGNNIGFEGKVDVPVHIDCVFSEPVVFVDNEKIKVI